MADGKNDFKISFRKITLKALKATIKAVLFHGLYLVLWMFLVPISGIVPGFQQAVETFVMIMTILIFLGELISGTIFQHFFNAAKVLFTICYLFFSLEGGILGISYQNVNLVVDLRLFLAIVVLLSLVEFAKSILQAINYLSEKAEYLPI